MSSGVLVTGASTGIGEAIARRLAGAGFTVFAGVRKDEDAERLRGLGAVAVKLDVTDRDQIAAVAREIDEQLGGERLAGVVNNAGVVVTAPLEFVDLDQLRHQLEVNAVAPVAVVQAFLPRLRRDHGRIVNISSIGGKVAQPFIGAYAMSKFAIEAMTDSLRRELHDWDIDVIAVEPGTIKTPMWDKGVESGDHAYEEMSAEGRALYGDRIERLRRFVPKLVERAGVPPEKVADAVHDALTADRPKLRYLVGDAKFLAAANALLPGRVMDRAMNKLS